VVPESVHRDDHQSRRSAPDSEGNAAAQQPPSSVDMLPVRTPQVPPPPAYTPIQVIYREEGVVEAAPCDLFVYIPPTPTTTRHVEHEALEYEAPEYEHEVLEHRGDSAAVIRPSPFLTACVLACFILAVLAFMRAMSREAK
jgi:hypothetical protein